MIESNGPETRVRKPKAIPGAAPEEHRVRKWTAAPLNMGHFEDKTAWQHPVATFLGQSVTHWAFVVACLYLLIFIAVTCPVIALPFYPDTKITEAAAVYLAWPYWLWVAIMFLCQAALLIVPVRVMSRRPVTRRPLILPVVVGGLMMGVLAVGAICTFWEMAELSHTRGPAFLPSGWNILWVAGGIWAAWAVVFYLISCRRSVASALAMQSCTVLTGSILELLVAIPTHIVARNRGYCCAGCASFVGLTLGTSVMLFAFGPALFFLFLARWRKLHPGRHLTSTGDSRLAGTECGLQGWKTDMRE